MVPTISSFLHDEIQFGPKLVWKWQIQSAWFGLIEQEPEVNFYARIARVRVFMVSIFSLYIGCMGFPFYSGCDSA